MKGRGSTWSAGLAAAAFGAAGGWALIAFLTWRSLGEGSRVGSPWTAVDGQTLLFDGAVQGLPVAGAALLVLIAALLGYAWVIRPVWGERRPASGPWMAAAGLIPGMLMLLAFARLVSLILPNPVAPGVIWTADLLAAGFVGWGLWRGRGGPRPGFVPRAWREIGLILLVFAGLLLFGVHIDRMHVMGSASHDFIREIYLSGPSAIGSSGHFPLISQHYDEPAFLYPVVYGLLKPGASASGTLTVIYWLFLAAARLSLMSLIYLSVRVLGLDRLSAFVLTLFVWAASLSMNPVASNVLFDSLSPLAVTLHPSRVLAPILPLLFVAFSVGLTRKPGPGSLLVAAAIGAGLSAMTVHVGLIFAWGAALIVMTALSPAGARSERLWLGGAAVGVLILLTFSFSYGLQGVPPAIRAAALAASTLVSGLILFVAALVGWAKREDEGRLEPLAWLGELRRPVQALQTLGPSVPYWTAAGAGYALGFALFGNVLARAWQKYLGPLWPWGGDYPYWDRYFGALATKKAHLMQPPFCVGGEPWGYRLLSEHCGSLPMFVRTYGLSAAVVTAVIAWWLARRPKDHGLPDRTLTMLFWGAVLCLVAQPLFFVVYDFVFSPDIKEEWARHLSVWLRNRLIETWFYGGLLLALTLLLRAGGPKTRFWAQSAMLAAIALYALSPLTMPAQMVVNAAYLANMVFGVR